MGVYIDKIDLMRLSKIRMTPTRSVLDVLQGYDLTEIDLVRCGECKHMRKYALRSDEPTGIWCHRWSVPRLVTDDDFCSYGERKTDEKHR